MKPDFKSDSITKGDFSMKKALKSISTVLVAGAMLFYFAACSSGDDGRNSNNTKTEETKTEETKTEETKTEETKSLKWTNYEKCLGKYYYTDESKNITTIEIKADSIDIADKKYNLDKLFTDKELTGEEWFFKSFFAYTDSQTILEDAYYKKDETNYLIENYSYTTNYNINDVGYFYNRQKYTDLSFETDTDKTYMYTYKEVWAQTPGYIKYNNYLGYRENIFYLIISDTELLEFTYDNDDSSVSVSLQTLTEENIKYYVYLWIQGYELKSGWTQDECSYTLPYSSYEAIENEGYDVSKKEEYCNLLGFNSDSYGYLFIPDEKPYYSETVTRLTKYEFEKATQEEKVKDNENTNDENDNSNTTNITGTYTFSTAVAPQMPGSITLKSDGTWDYSGNKYSITGKTYKISGSDITITWLSGTMEVTETLSISSSGTTSTWTSSEKQVSLFFSALFGVTNLEMTFDFSVN